MSYFPHACLVVIRTWWKPGPFCCPQQLGFNRVDTFEFSNSQSSVTSLPWWGRVVIGSLFVYQTSGAGSNPVVSTTVLDDSTRPIGIGQCSCFVFAGKSLEESGLFLISNVIYWKPFQVITSINQLFLSSGSIKRQLNSLLSNLWSSCGVCGFLAWDTKYRVTSPRVS